jgi:hypothetical protein
LCFQKFVIDQCKCYLPNAYSFSESNPCVTVLDMFCFYRAYGDYFDHYFLKECHKICPVECETTKFITQTTFSDFPSKMAFNMLFDDNSNIKKYHGNNKNLSFESLKREMINLNFYFEELKYAKSSEIPNLTFIQLIAKIGINSWPKVWAFLFYSFWIKNNNFPFLNFFLRRDFGSLFG